MKKPAFYLVLMLLVFPLSLPSERFEAHEEEDQTLTPQEILTAEKLRTYCRACHGLNKLRFIYSEDDFELWQTLKDEVAPNSGKLWVDAIYDVLNWPSDEPPPFSQKISPEKDWMPKGSKRLRFANDLTEDKPSRKIMLEALKNYPR